MHAFNEMIGKLKEDAIKRDKMRRMAYPDSFKDQPIIKNPNNIIITDVTAGMSIKHSDLNIGAVGWNYGYITV